MDLLERLLADRIKAKGTEMAKEAAEAELHGQCKHPVEIADVRRTMKRRNAVNIGLLSTVLTLVAMLVGVAVYAATINNNVAHLQAESARVRITSEKEANDRRSEDQAIRRELNEAQRANNATHQELISTTVEIKTLLKVLAEDRPTRRR